MALYVYRAYEDKFRGLNDMDCISIVEADNLDDSFIAQIVDVIVENFAISPENITIESVNV